MLKDIKEEDMSLLSIYASILDGCTNKLAIKFLISRIFRILKKSFKVRKASDFPQTSQDLQIVYLVNYIREGKMAYAFLYASSLHASIPKDIKEKANGSLWCRIIGYFIKDKEG